MQALKLFFATLIVCICLDATWLFLIAKNAYMQALGGLMRKSGEAFAPNFAAIIAVYVLLVIGVLVFVLPRAETNLSAFFWGALFGLILYGVFNFTNFGVLANWPITISLLDLAWGMLLCALTSLFAFYIE